MLVQSKTIVSQEISIHGVSKGKFNFNQHFKMGGRSGTNLSFRNPEFYEAFQQNARRQCEMPETVKFIDVPLGYRGTLEKILKEAHSFKAFWGLRVPIKLIGHMRDVQKLGEAGHLMVCGTPNIFLSRAADNTLHLVKMKFVPFDKQDPNSGSWRIKSRLFNPDKVIEGSARIFIACRN